ncbi:MAG: hypothetical protein ACK5NT_12485 [Pyrinomonadaceae bacterium]
MIKKPIMFLAHLCLIANIAVNAQTQQFDLVEYSAPVDWTKTESNAAVAFTRIDSTSGAFGLITVNRSKRASGSSREDFRESWKSEIIGKIGKSAMPEILEDKTSDNWVISSGVAEVETSEVGKAVVFLSVYGKADVKIEVIGLINNQTYLQEFQGFVGSLRIVRNQDSNSRRQEAKTSSRISNLEFGEKVQLWMGAAVKLTDITQLQTALNYSTKLEWRVVLSNGDFFNDLPIENGFLNVTRNMSGVTWGKFTLSNGRGSFKTPYETVEVRQVDANTLEKPGYTFRIYKVPSVDNVKLNGTYGVFPNWSVEGIGTANGCKQLISFKPDGSFIDFGAFVTNCSMPNQYAERAPGSGTYQIQNFTLVLDYSDGRRIAKTFSGGIKPVTQSSEAVFINGNPFYNK